MSDTGTQDRRSQIPAAAAVTAEVDELQHEGVTRMRVNRVVPWIASITAHVLFVVLGFLIPWTTSLILSHDEEPRAVVADFHSLRRDPLYTPDYDLSQEPEATDSRIDDSALEQEMAAELLSSAIGAEALLPGPLSDDALRSFAPEGRDRAVSFGGLRGSNVLNVAYIVDASGSMLAYLPIVIDELIRSVDQLDESQQFCILFFQNDEAIIVPPPGSRSRRPTGAGRRAQKREPAEYITATRENRQWVYDWIDLSNQNISAGGRSNPLEAFKAALRELDPAPDVIFVLSTDITGSGEYEIERDVLLNQIHDYNKKPGSDRPKSIIKTLQFVEQDPLDTLRLIAEQNGGVEGYKMLTREELGL
ncbi:MAG: hypothetical protein D8M59_09980 [Planctomycetes bacterium]|nr:hypothetical protein [Planctomycetota bacterium]NOG53413.1 hypothetical protein [Planctomycetota bacterium]